MTYTLQILCPPADKEILQDVILCLPAECISCTQIQVTSKYVCLHTGSMTNITAIHSPQGTILYYCSEGC